MCMKQQEHDAQGRELFNQKAAQSAIFKQMPANFVFCPTAQDILEALPPSCSVSKGLSGFVVKHGYHPQEFGIYTGPTLVEALGNAYLAIHKQS